MRHPCKRSLIIIGLHFDGQHQSGPDTTMSNVGSGVPNSFNTMALASVTRCRETFITTKCTAADRTAIARTKRRDAGRLGCYLPACSRFSTSRMASALCVELLRFRHGTQPMPRCRSTRWHQPSTNALCTLSHLPVPCAYSTSAGQAMSSCHCSDPGMVKLRTSVLPSLL